MNHKPQVTYSKEWSSESNALGEVCNAVAYMMCGLRTVRSKLLVLNECKECSPEILALGASAYSLQERCGTAEVLVANSEAQAMSSNCSKE